MRVCLKKAIGKGSGTRRLSDEAIRIQNGRRVLYLGGTNQQIEIGELAQGHIAICKLGKNRTFECDRCNRLSFEEGGKPQEFAHEQPVTQRVLLKMKPQFTHRRRRNENRGVSVEESIDR